jgi:hypothetical protein
MRTPNIKGQVQEGSESSIPLKTAYFGSDFNLTVFHCTSDGSLAVSQVTAKNCNDKRLDESG